MPFFQKPKSQKIQIDTEKNKFVPVIVSYDTNGNCKPIYFRYIHNTGESETIKIDYVNYSKPNSFYGMYYYCFVTIQEVQLPIVLFHIYESNRWALRMP